MSRLLALTLVALVVALTIQLGQANGVNMLEETMKAFQERCHGN